MGRKDYILIAGALRQASRDSGSDPSRVAGGHHAILRLERQVFLDVATGEKGMLQ